MKEAKFKIGEKVHYTNPAGVYWGIKEIKEVKKISYSDSGYGYIFTETETPWYAVSEENLKLIDNKDVS